jgi:glycosyltransferase involved in cell wall biosynthesis
LAAVKVERPPDHNMRIGIYTHYAHCDEAYFTLRLVDLLRKNGADYSIYSDSVPAKLSAAQDNRVVHKRRCKYTHWARDCSTIIWTHTPKIEQLNYAKRLGITTLVVPMWQDLVRPFRKVLKNTDHVIALTTECRELFASVYKFKNVTLIPFDAGMPVVKKTKQVNERQVKIFLPWFDRNARCANSQFLNLLGYLLPKMPDARLTVAISSSRFAPGIAKFFQKLGQKTNGRVKLVRNIPLNKRPAVYTEHDLTIFPAECDNYGVCGLTSINCGTPVLAFNLSPQNDYIYPNTNGILVKTQIDFDDNGVPHAAPDYESLVTALQTLIAEPWHIDALNKQINYNLAARRKSFDLGWQTILRLV